MGACWGGGGFLGDLTLFDVPKRVSHGKSKLATNSDPGYRLPQSSVRASRTSVTAKGTGVEGVEKTCSLRSGTQVGLD